MSDFAAHIDSFLAGIVFCPPATHSTVRLVDGPGAGRFNRLFDDSTELLMEICREVRLPAGGARGQVPDLPAQDMAELMLVLALQMSLIASHLADSRKGRAGSLKETPPDACAMPFGFLFEPDLRFWETVLRHAKARVFLEAFKAFDERARLRCVAVMTCSSEPAAEIDRFVESPDRRSYLSDRLSRTAAEIRTAGVGGLPALKKAIAWSIAASVDTPPSTRPADHGYFRPGSRREGI